MKNYVYFVTDEKGKKTTCKSIEEVKKIISMGYSEMFLDNLSFYEEMTEKDLKELISKFFTDIKNISDYKDSTLNEKDYTFEFYRILKTEEKE